MQKQFLQTCLLAKLRLYKSDHYQQSEPLLQGHLIMVKV